MRGTATGRESGPPAIRGGEPAFPEGLPLVRPPVPDPETFAGDVRAILESRRLTNGPRVEEFERRAAEYLGVRNAIAVSSCTAGLMLAIRCAGLEGDVLVPSFTFAATAHAVAWCGLRPVFADVDRETLTLAPAALAEANEPAAVLATHVYGTPCDVDGLATAAEAHGARVLYDAAHAFGSRRRGVPVGGFGDAEIFSLSPTKVIVAGEGGVVATQDDELAERIRVGRDYGNPGDYDMRFVGLNARMSELHAALALRSLEGLDARIDRRNVLARRYRDALRDVAGVSFPTVPEGDRSTYTDFTMLVEPDAFGGGADALGQALAAEGVETRRYYSPPVHRTQAYLGAATVGPLPVTEWASARALTVPMWSDMTEEQVDRVAAAIRRIHAAAPGG